MPMRRSARTSRAAPTPNGETVRKCNLDLAPEAPWRCPDDCPALRAPPGRRRLDPRLAGHPAHARRAAEASTTARPQLLDEAEDIVNAAVDRTHGPRSMSSRPDRRRSGPATSGRLAAVLPPPWLSPGPGRRRVLRRRHRASAAWLFKANPDVWDVLGFLQIRRSRSTHWRMARSLPGRPDPTGSAVRAVGHRSGRIGAHARRLGDRSDHRRAGRRRRRSRRPPLARRRRPATGRPFVETQMDVLAAPVARDELAGDPRFASAEILTSPRMAQPGGPSDGRARRHHAIASVRRAGPRLA